MTVGHLVHLSAVPFCLVYSVFTVLPLLAPLPEDCGPRGSPSSCLDYIHTHYLYAVNEKYGA